MDEKKAGEDLAFIRNVMEGVRHRNIIDGIYYVIWGVIVPLCSVIDRRMLIAGRGETGGTVWLIGIGLGVVLCLGTGWLRGRKGIHGPRGAEARLFYTAWIAFAATGAVLLAVGCGTGKLGLGQGLFVLGLLLAMVYAIDGSFGRLRGLFAVSAGWLLAGVAALWLSKEYASFVFGLTAVPLCLIPGLILIRMSRTDNHGTP